MFSQMTSCRLAIPCRHDMTIDRSNDRVCLCRRSSSIVVQRLNDGLNVFQYGRQTVLLVVRELLKWYSTWRRHVWDRVLGLTLFFPLLVALQVVSRVLLHPTSYKDRLLGVMVLVLKGGCPGTVVPVTLWAGMSIKHGRHAWCLRLLRSQDGELM